MNADGVDSKLRVQTGNSVKYFVTDHLGSTTGFADSSGNISNQTSYDSFGNASTTLPTRYRYTGREYDDFTGLYHYRARSYDPKIGRFISEDPIGLAGGINQFGYVDGNPLNSTDPSGLYPGGTVLEELNRFSQSPEVVEFATMASSPEGRALVATGGSAALAYGSTSVAVAGAAPIAVTVGAGAAIGGAIGLPIGNYTARLAGNPFVNGSLNPFGRSAADVANDPWNPKKPQKNCDENKRGLALGFHPYEEALALATGSTTYLWAKGPTWRQSEFLELANNAHQIHFTLEGFKGHKYREFEELVNRTGSGNNLDSIRGNYTNKEYYLITHNPALRAKTKFYE